MPFTAVSVRGWRRIAFASLVFLILGATGFAAYRSWQGQVPYARPIAECAELPETVAPTGSWRFRTDPDDSGIKNHWFDQVFDDSGWPASNPGEAWQPEYVGVAWYRATFSPPLEWGTAYLGVGQVDDSAELWINGTKLNWDPASGPGSQIITLTVGPPVQLSFRILNQGGPGGIKQPVLVGRNPRSVLPPDGYVRWLASTHPEWPMPGWARNDYYAWTFTGLPGAENKALIGSDGAVAPWPSGSNVSLWVYDPTHSAMVVPKPVFSLLDKSLPIPQTEGQAAGLEIQTTLFRTIKGDATRWLANLNNETDQAKEVTLLAVVRPLGFNPGTRPTFAAGFDQDGRLWLDGQPFMETSSRASKFGVGTLVEVYDAVQTGSVPKAVNMSCAPAGDVAAVSTFPIRLQPGDSFRLSLDFPSDPGAPFPTSLSSDDLEAARGFWQDKTDVSIEIPDETITNSYRASLGYLLLALSPSGPRPGPLEHAKVWVRDASFIGEALLGAGHGARVEEYLPKLFQHQTAEGRIPAIIGPAGPEPPDEWDAQGQAITLVATVYRYQKDLAFLQRWEPSVKRAAVFIRSLRQHTADNPPATHGLLPPSKSAEDLGPAEWHHYWDDFWAVAGLEEASYIESQLGNSQEANWMRTEAQELRQAIRRSVENVLGSNPGFIPGAPEDLTSSAMARGTSVALYPVEVFPWDDPLIVRSFETYYAKWIAPNDGGYRHIWDQWWPYGGLGLARDYLRLGRQDVVHQILAWTLTHQTLPGTYAWAEQVDPSHGGISGGDMPHAWAAASYVALIREMLAVRHGDQLELFAGVPPSWLDAGKTVGLKSAPTEFGTLTALVESSLNMSGAGWNGTLILTIQCSTQPAGGFVWRLPRTPQSIEGPPGVQIHDGKLFVPGSGGVVKLGYIG